MSSPPALVKSVKAGHSITTRSLLLERLKNLGDEEGWREFVGMYHEFIRRLALKANLTEHEAQDIVQEVLVSVARNIQGFKYDPAISSFRHWLTKVIRWRIADQHKRRLRDALMFDRPPSGKSHESHALHQIPDSAAVLPDEELDRGWGRAIIAKALDRVKQTVSPKQYQIYYLHVLKDKPVAEVCRRLKVNRGQVYLVKLRVGRLLENELRSLRSTEH